MDGIATNVLLSLFLKLDLIIEGRWLQGVSMAVAYSQLRLNGYGFPQDLICIQW